MRWANIALCLGLSLPGAPGRADPADPLAQADLVSAIGLARLADEVGDGRLLSWLEQPGRRDLALVALRAAPFAFAPERLVAGLAHHACGRDPVLAPEAGVALVQIAERLHPSELELREVLRADLRAAKAALGCMAELRPPARADLRAAAGLLEWRLGQLDAAP
jgi:hypothetical protein